MNQHISILGAGLVGSLTALLLRQKGHEVTVYERRPDMRRVDISAGKSINLAMSTRGWKALEIAGIREEIEKIALPMYGRCIHDLDGETHIQNYGKNNEAIYSVSRGDLNKTLMNEAEKAGCTFIFDFKAKRVDIQNNVITFENNNINQKKECEFIIGADGAFSTLRTGYIMTDRVDYNQFYIDHGYKELHIEENADGSWKMANNALHIWPRKNFMLIALPNIDGSFTVTLFLPFEGANSFASLNSPDKIDDFFNSQFGDVVPLLNDLHGSFANNPTSSLVTIKTYPWGWQDKNFLIGDAAHAIVPFYGQGMNAGFEDCTVLMELMAQYDNWSDIIQHFQKSRKINADAVADLALRNFIEMRDWVAEPEFLERKKIEKQLGRDYPQLFNSVYEMVSFTNTPYHIAWECTQLQDELLNQIMALGDWDDIISHPDKKLQMESYLNDYKQKFQSIH